MMAARALGSSWIDQAHARASLVEVLAELGTRVKGKYAAPCPACREERRSRTGPRRDPVDVDRAKGLWHCKRGGCDVGGDIVDAVAWRLFGAHPPQGDERWGDVRAWFADRGYCDPAGDARGRQSPRSALRPVRIEEPAPDPAPLRPPAEEVASLWRASWPVLADEEVAAWLGDVRGIDPAAVEWGELARAVPVELVERGALPPWARLDPRESSAWPAHGYRLIVPMYGPSGAMESVRARHLTPAREKKDRKATDPYRTRPPGDPGYTSRGLVMADPLGRAMLETGAPPAWWPAGHPFRVVVAEGEPDFLKAAAAWGDCRREEAPWTRRGASAVFGIVSGSWTPETLDLAARVPDGARVYAFTDSNPAGDTYAEKVRASLAPRCNVIRLDRAKMEPATDARS